MTTMTTANEGLTRHRFDTRVVLNRPLCREHFLLRLRVVGPGEFPPTRPGQFVQLGCRPPEVGVDPAAMLGRDLEWTVGQRPALSQPELCGALAMLRRPFSLAGRGRDEQGDWLDVIHRVIGVGTDWLSRLAPGDAVDLIGPLGNVFELPEGYDIGLMVGGGVGLPPMFYLAEALANAGWRGTAFVGAMCEDLLAVTRCDGQPPAADGSPTPCAQEFARHGIPAAITTDDGSVGLHGRITVALERQLEAQTDAERRRTVIFTCGPNPMMRAVADLAQRFGVACQVCLEQAMACGMGTCQSCIVRIEEHDRPPHAVDDTGRPWRYRLACTDGPVFPAAAVLW